MKTLLISAPYRDLYGPIKSAAGYYFPLGLGYVASYLKQNGYQVSLYEPEAQHFGYPDIKKLFEDERPDVVGIGSATPNFHNAVEVARLAKSVGAKTVLGGVHASALAPFITEKFHDVFDYVATGEGEHIMLELLKRIESGRPADDVNGLTFMKDGKVFSAPPCAYIEDLDSIPFPAREMIPQEIFYPNLHNARYKKCFTLLTSRGCPFKCSFCASHKTLGSRYRMHSPEYVLSEMEMLKKDYGARQLIITDDTFTINRERLVAMCEGMIKKKLNLEWFCFSQVTAVNDEILKLMRRAGCYNIGFGVESGSPRILELMGKPISPEKCKKAIDSSEKLGIKTQAFFIFGHEENMEEVESTVQLAIDLNPTLAFFNMLVPYPGTRDFDRFFKDVPLDTIDWKNFVAIGESSVLGRTKLNLEKLVYEANMRFYRRPSQIYRILKHIKTWHEMANYFKGALALVKQMISWKATAGD